MLIPFFCALKFIPINNNQYHGIHIYFHIISLELPTTALCFSFESTYHYSKDLYCQQKFVDLPVSLARYHQTIECCNVINIQLKPDSHLLFATGKKAQCNKLMEDNETVDLQIKIQRLRTLLLGHFKSLNM